MSDMASSDEIVRSGELEEWALTTISFACSSALARGKPVCALERQVGWSAAMVQKIWDDLDASLPVDANTTTRAISFVASVLATSLNIVDKSKLTPELR